MELEGFEQQSSNEKIINVQPGKTNMEPLDPETLQAKELGEKENLGVSFASPTPEKPEWNSKGKDISSLVRKQLNEHFHNEAFLEKSACSHGISKIDKDEMPEKYTILADLFNRIETSIRLLGLRKLLPTFQNICKQVEVLSKRKLLYSHLAQMIYIFPEALKIEKILLHNQETLLMVPDMKITLVKDVLDHPHSHQSISVPLSSAFHARLLDFLAIHPEGTDIPEGVLPDPFNHRDTMSHEKMLPEECIQLLPQTQGLESMPHEKVLPEEECYQPPPNTLSHEPMLSGLHLPKSFKRHFSKKALAEEGQKTQLLVTQESLDPIKSCVKNDESRNPQKLSHSSSALRSTVVEHNIHHHTLPQHPESTPVKSDSSPGHLFTCTPAQQTPKRAVPSTQDKMSIDSEDFVTEERLTTSARRSLIYSPTSSKQSTRHQDVDMSQMRNVVGYSSEQIVSAKRSLWEDEARESPNASLDVMYSGHVSNLNQLGDCKSSKEHACLLETFDAICLISHSTKNLLLTKEELVHKILSTNLEIEETRVAEQHLELLEQLLPDWIHKQALSTGQCTYCIKHPSDREACRAKLVESS